MTSFFLDLVICWGGSENSEYLLMFTSLLKDIIKGTGIQPDEEIHRVEFGRVPSVGASVPMELGQITLPVHGRVHPPGSSQNPVLLRFLLRLPHVGMIYY